MVWFFLYIDKFEEITEKEYSMLTEDKKRIKTHYKIGKNIREVIVKNGGTMPENLPTPNKSLK